MYHEILPYAGGSQTHGGEPRLEARASTSVTSMIHIRGCEEENGGEVGEQESPEKEERSQAAKTPEPKGERDIKEEGIITNIKYYMKIKEDENLRISP